MLFWVGQKRDSVLSRSPAPRSNCSGLRERNLPVATLWPSPTSGTLGGRRFRAEKSAGDQAGAGQTKLAQGIVRWSRWKGRTARSLGFGWTPGALTRSGSREFKGRPRDNKTIGSVQPNLPSSSVDRQESQQALVVLTRPQPQAPNLLGATWTGQHTGHFSIGIDGKVKPRWRTALSVGTDEKVKPAGATAWLVGPMEGQDQAGPRHGRLVPMKGQTRLAQGSFRWGREARSSTVLSGCNGQNNGNTDGNGLG